MLLQSEMEIRMWIHILHTFRFVLTVEPPFTRFKPHGAVWFTWQFLASLARVSIRQCAKKAWRGGLHFHVNATGIWCRGGICRGFVDMFIQVILDRFVGASEHREATTFYLLR